MEVLTVVHLVMEATSTGKLCNSILFDSARYNSLPVPYFLEKEKKRKKVKYLFLKCFRISGNVLVYPRFPIDKCMLHFFDGVVLKE